MKKRIISLHFTAPPDIGGVEYAAFEIALAANNMANYSGVLVSGTDDKCLPESCQGVERKYIPEISSHFPLNRKIFDDFKYGKYPKELRDLTEYIFNELNKFILPGDFIISHNVFCQPFNIALTAALRLIHEHRSDFMHLTWCHDLSIKEPEYNWTLKHQHPWNLMWTFCPGVQYVVNTNPLAEDMSQLMNCDISFIKTIPVGINIYKTLRITKKIETIYRSRNLIHNYPVIFVPAKMSLRKNLPRVIHLIDELREKITSPHLVVAGSMSPHDVNTGTYSFELKKLIQKNNMAEYVTVLAWEPEFNGKVSLDHAVSMVALSDLLLFTSIRETFQIPILEACLHGVPVITPESNEVKSWANNRAVFYDINAPNSEIVGIMLDIIDNKWCRLKHLTRLNHSWDQILKNNIIVKSMPR